MKLFKFIAGLVGGTALGLLFATKKGADLRKELKGKDSKKTAELIGKELLEVGKGVGKTVKEYSETKEAKGLKAKAASYLKNLKKNIVSNCKSCSGKEGAVTMAKETVKKVKAKAKKAVKKAVSNIQK